MGNYYFSKHVPLGTGMSTLMRMVHVLLGTGKTYKELKQQHVSEQLIGTFPYKEKFSGMRHLNDLSLVNVKPLHKKLPLLSHVQAVVALYEHLDLGGVFDEEMTAEQILATWFTGIEDQSASSVMREVPLTNAQQFVYDMCQQLLKRYGSYDHIKKAYETLYEKNRFLGKESFSKYAALTSTIRAGGKQARYYVPMLSTAEIFMKAHQLISEDVPPYTAKTLRKYWKQDA